MTNDFHQISIRGRYIYCYLCLRSVIISKGLEDIPEFLNVILKTFTISSKLDDWQDVADDVMPSRLLEQENDVEHYKVISYQQVLSLRSYYLNNKLATEVIENLIWLGITNLYVGFNSSYTFECVKNIIEILNNNNVELPKFSIIKSCLVTEKGGWGNNVDMDDFLVGNN